MSVLMTLRVPADGAKLMEFVEAQPDALSAILAKARTQGVISHRFYAAGNEILVLDEWPDEASFHAFFAASPEIQDIMVAAGASGPPVITFWTKLDTGDEV